jgi:hypothetical protein
MDLKTERFRPAAAELSAETIDLLVAPRALPLAQRRC